MFLVFLNVVFYLLVLIVFDVNRGLIFETFGAVSEPAMEFFRKIADMVNNNPYAPWSWGEIFHSLINECSLMLQAWNAKILRQAVRFRK